MMSSLNNNNTFEIRNHETNEAIYTAKINGVGADGNALPFYKRMSIAVIEAVKNNVSLRFASLRSLDLRDADLSNADLSEADLSNAYLSGTNLSGANLKGARLSFATLRGVNFTNANLWNVNFIYTDLKHANFHNTDLRHANLERANLEHAKFGYGVDLRGANLSEANLNKTDMRYYKSDVYECWIQEDYLRVEWRYHTWEEWLSFSDDEIMAMEPCRSLKWWKTHKPILMSIRDTILTT